jgi:SAM-dependent methyltransferase
VSASRLLRGLLIAVGLAAAAGCARAPGSVVPYVQTPHEVVSAMLRLADVKADDVVYDLGSGDGRVVIAAARLYGAQGVGVEIEHHLVVDSQASARSAGVSHRVRFVEQDLFLTDVSPATVVTLYLGADLNERLRPKLLAELRPGSRIVSHDFPMANWAPAQMISVSSRDRSHTLYLWVVPEKR